MCKRGIENANVHVHTRMYIAHTHNWFIYNLTHNNNFVRKKNFWHLNLSSATTRSEHTRWTVYSGHNNINRHWQKWAVSAENKNKNKKIRILNTYVQKSNRCAIFMRILHDTRRKKKRIFHWCIRECVSILYVFVSPLLLFSFIFYPLTINFVLHYMEYVYIVTKCTNVACAFSKCVCEYMFRFYARSHKWNEHCIP